MLDPDRAQRLELAAVGAALARLREAEGYDVYMRLLDRLISDIGTQGLRDKDNPREYWVGAQDILQTLKTAVEIAIEGAQQVAEQEEAVGRVLDVRLGGGTLAV